MRFMNILAAVAASSLVVAPAVAAPTTAASALSLSNVAGVKAVSSTRKASKLFGGGSGAIIAIGAIVAIGLGIYIAADSGSNNKSASR